MIKEYSIKLDLKLPEKAVSSKMETFYNPQMTSNRNISILLLNSLSNKNMRLALPLAGSGIRGFRYLKELKKDKIKELHLNDHKENYLDSLKGTIELNKLTGEKLYVHNQEASLFLLNQQGFDYIDIDPFGSPNPFLAAAVARINRKGILAVTSTDTAALTGTYFKATKRKYWAKPLKNYLMHELGLRILIRKVQLQGIQFNKALIPVLAYYKDHYYRVYFVSANSKEESYNIAKQHQYFLYCKKCLDFKSSEFNKEKCSCGNSFQYSGPLWVGKLFNKKLLAKMLKDNKFKEEQKFLKILEKEKDVLGFYDLHVLAKNSKQNSLKLEETIKKTRGSRTHFSCTGFKLTSQQLFQQLVRKQS